MVRAHSHSLNPHETPVRIYARDYDAELSEASVVNASDAQEGVSLAGFRQMGAIDETIDTAIELTDLVLAHAAEHAQDAIASLRSLDDFLANSMPRHPALRKLSRYIAAIESREAGQTLQ